MNYNWDWSVYLQPAADGSGTWLHYLVVGLGWTLATALAAWVIALVIGSVVGTLRTTPMQMGGARSATPTSRSSATSRCSCRCSCGSSWCPSCCRRRSATRSSRCRRRGARTSRRCCASGSTPRCASPSRCAPASSRCRAARCMAGTALGLTLPQTYRYVLLPMAFRIILPPLTSEFLNVIKNSSVALTIGLLELTGRARAMQEFSFKVFEAFAAATRDLPAHQPRRGAAACACSSARCACPGSSARAPQSTGGPLMFAGYDFDVIQRSLGLPLPRGHDVHASRSRCWRWPAASSSARCSR